MLEAPRLLLSLALLPLYPPEPPPKAPEPPEVPPALDEVALGLAPLPPLRLEAEVALGAAPAAPAPFDAVLAPGLVPVCRAADCWAVWELACRLAPWAVPPYWLAVAWFE